MRRVAHREQERARPVRQQIVKRLVPELVGLRAARWRLLEPQLPRSIERVAVPAEPALGDPRTSGEHVLRREARRSVLEERVVPDLGRRGARPHPGGGHHSLPLPVSTSTLVRNV